MLEKNEDGTYPSVAWPGLYPLVYVCADGGNLCAPCANRQNGSEAGEDADCQQWRLVGVDIHWDGAPIICAHCEDAIASAYGEDA